MAIQPRFFSKTEAARFLGYTNQQFDLIVREFKILSTKRTNPKTGEVSFWYEEGRLRRFIDEIATEGGDFAPHPST